jgi:hypothetical protein
MGSQIGYPAAEGLHTQLAPLEQGWAEGGLALGEAQQVGGDAHLAVAVLAGADPDHWDAQVVPQAAGQGRGHVFEY